MKNNGDIIQFVKRRDYIMLNNALGNGSFGTTALLKDPFIDELFVAKKYEPAAGVDKVKYYKNFLDEIKLLHKLHHRNIVRIFNYYAYEEMNTGYIIMEYVEGMNIGEFISDYFAPFSDTDLDTIFVQLIDGFQYIEEHGIIHRDIREGNILVDKTGIVKIIDFGIGKSFDIEGCNNDSLNSKINRANSDTLPDEYYEGVYTSKTDQYYLAELFNRLMREAEHVDESDFSYHDILTKMMQKNYQNRFDTFTELKETIEKHDFSVMYVSADDKRKYQAFVDKIFESLSSFTDEMKFNTDTGFFITRLEKSLTDNLFEDYIQKNADVISAIVTGAYRYNNDIGINCSAVKEFLDWFKSTTKPSQQLIINNIIAKLSSINVVIDDNLPF